MLYSILRRRSICKELQGCEQLYLYKINKYKNYSIYPVYIACFQGVSKDNYNSETQKIYYKINIK